MAWIESPTEDFRSPLYRNEHDWTLYYWRGRDRAWVICRSDGTRFTVSREFDEYQIAQAQDWADRLLKDRTRY